MSDYLSIFCGDNVLADYWSNYFLKGDCHV